MYLPFIMHSSYIYHIFIINTYLPFIRHSSDMYHTFIINTFLRNQPHGYVNIRYMDAMGLHFRTVMTFSGISGVSRSVPHESCKEDQTGANLLLMKEIRLNTGTQMTLVLIGSSALFWRVGSLQK